MAMVVVAGCGGGGDSLPTTTTRGHRTTTTTTAKTTTTAGSITTARTGIKSGAKVRVVNLAVQSRAGVPIDVYAGVLAVGKPLATVNFGAASPYLDPPKNGQDTTLSFYFHGKTDPGSKLIDQSGSLGAGDQQTYLVWYGADGGSGTPVGHVQAVVEAAPSGSSSAANIPKVPDLKAVVQAVGSQLGTLGNDLSFDVGLPVGGCLPQQAAPGAGSGVRDLVGGTNLVDYVTDPGSQQVGLFTSSSGNCASAPAAGPTSIDPPVGSVTLLVAFGTDPSTIKLLVLPVSY